MKNFEISLPLVDGSMQDIFYDECSGKEVVHQLITDDFGAPPRSMYIQVETKTGKKVKIHIPYDDYSDASVSIDGEILE
jgi:hypothetical protein